MSEIENERTQLRSRMVGGLRAEHAAERVELAGWVHRRRNLGGLVFVDLRDRSGLVQVSFGPDWTDAAAMETAGYTVSTSGNISKVLKSQEAGQAPIDVRTGRPTVGRDRYIPPWRGVLIACGPKGLAHALSVGSI